MCQPETTILLVSELNTRLKVRPSTKRIKQFQAHALILLMEKRKHIRESVTFTVELTDGVLGKQTFQARNFSKSGIFLERTDSSTPLPPVGAKVHLVIKWPMESELAPLEVDADITRQEDDGVGARFVIE